MKKLLLSLFAIPLISSGEPALVGGCFSVGEGSEIRDLVARPDGALVVTGTIGSGSKLPEAGKTHRLLEGNYESGIRGFVAEFSADLSALEWLALFPADCIEPTRIALDADGSVAIGGKHLGGLAALDAKEENWNKSSGALAKLTSEGERVLWVSPGGPNQGEVTGLDVDEQGRVYFTAGSKVRQAANYLLRKNGDTGENEPWVDDAWCVYLHTNQEPLKAEGQYLSFYDRANKESEDGFGYDYDGRDEGWGPVTFSLKGFRIGGEVVVLPGGDLIVSSCLQYDFRVNNRTPEGLKKGKGFPAFDYFLARYSPDGELRWSTNLYQPGDSVHTPDQKPIDLTYDPKSDAIYALVKQHGSNVYRFKGELYGDTGNLMISWLGKIEASNGELEAGWYFQNNRLGNFGANGVPKSPPYPKLAGNALRRVLVGKSGSVFVAGSGAAQTWTTPDALQPWPEGQAGGSEGALLKLSGDLQTVQMATCLFADTAESFVPHGLAITDKGVILAGRGSFAGELAEKATRTEWSDSGQNTGCLIFVIPEP